jgi:hypothetical protein
MLTGDTATFVVSSRIGTHHLFPLFNIEFYARMGKLAGVRVHGNELGLEAATVLWGILRGDYAPPKIHKR